MLDQLRFHHLVSLGEGEVVAVRVDVDRDRVAFAELAAEDALGQRVLDPLLDDALERAGAERRVVALVGEQLLRRVGQRPASGSATPGACAGARAARRRSA